MNEQNPLLTKIIKTSTEGPLENHKWKYWLYLPEWLSRWDVWDYWEKERISSMESELKKGNILFDVGSESGWMSALFAKYIVGGENIVLFEPSYQYWPTIRQIWRMNNLSEPKYCWNGFVGNEDSKYYGLGLDGVWPSVSLQDPISSGMPYEYINGEEHIGFSKVPIVRLDKFVKEEGIIPRGITIDVEGAELEVIKGSVKLLIENDVLVWISIHPDLMLKNFKVNKSALMMLMEKIGYRGELLGIDHEEHWLFKKVKNGKS